MNDVVCRLSKYLLAQALLYLESTFTSVVENQGNITFLDVF